MVKMTASFEHWLWEKDRELFALISFGHLELLTDELSKEYLEWCQTEEAKAYFPGGAHYHEPR